VRAAVAVLLALPAVALAGCSASAHPAPPIEAFEARYRIVQEAGAAPYEVLVRLSDQPSYLDFDGRPRAGYAVDVEVPAAERTGRPQSIVDGAFHEQRHRWCNGWTGGGPCDTDQYDWPAIVPELGYMPDGGPDHASQRAVMGVGATVAPAPGTLRRMGHGWSVADDKGGQRFEFADDRLAPTRIVQLDDGGRASFTYAERLSYTRTGGLPPLGTRPAEYHATTDAGPGLPRGSDQDVFGQGFSLASALAFLRQNDSASAAILRDGCVDFAAGSARQDGPASPTAPPVRLSDEATADVVVEVSNATASRAVRITYGHRALGGADGFLGVEQQAAFQRGMACGPGRAAIGLVEALALAHTVMPEAVQSFQYWRQQGQRGDLGMTLLVNGGGSSATVSLGAGTLRSLATRAGGSIDPAAPHQNG